MAQRPRRRRRAPRWQQAAREELEWQRDELQRQVGWTDEDGVHHKGILVEELEREAAGEHGRVLHPHPRGYIYWVVVGLYLVAQLFLLVVALTADWFSIITHFVGLPVNVGLLVVGLQFLHLAFSLRQVGVDQLAGIDFFGRPAKTQDPGLVLVPRFLLRLTTISRNYVDVRFPGPPQELHRISAKMAAESPTGDTPPEGKVRPIFVTTGKAKYSREELEELERGEDADPLDVQMNIDISFFVRFRPNPELGGIFRIIRNLSRENFVERAKNLLREQMETNVTELLSTQTVSTTIANRQLVNEVLYLKTIFTTLRFGIETDQARTVELNPSHETNEAQAKAVRARFGRSQGYVEADTERQRRTQVGIGDAAAVQYRLNAQARGYKKIATDTGASGEAIIASETAREALSEKADVVVLGSGGGFADLLGLVQAGKTLLTRKPEERPNHQPPTTEESS